MLVDSLCYLLSSVSWDSAALNKTAVSISSQCAHKIPHHTISREHSAISKRTSKRTKWNFFFDVVVANCCFSVMRWWKPFYVAQRENWQSWTDSIRFENPQRQYYMMYESDYWTWATAVAAAATAVMWSFIFGLTILDLMKSKMVDTHFQYH